MSLRIKPVGFPTVTVTTSGTPVRASSTSVPCSSISIQAKETNAGDIIVKDASGYVLGVLSARQFFSDSTTEVDTLLSEKLLDVSDYYLDASANGQAAYVSYRVRKP